MFDPPSPRLRRDGCLMLVTADDADRPWSGVKDCFSETLKPAREARALPRDTPQKFLAQDAARLQARSAMSTFARSNNRGRAFIAIFVSAAFFWTLALSVCPQLHQFVHADANRVEHSCAATMIASGSYDHAAHPPLVSAPDFALQFSKILALSSTWVQPLFLAAHIFAHAPPAHS